MAGTLKKKIYATVPHYIEKYLFSVLFFRYTYLAVNRIIVNDQLDMLGTAYQAGGIFSSEFAACAHSLNMNVMLALFNACTGAMLLKLQKPRRAPENFLDVLVPTVATFSMLAYNITSYLPREMLTRLLPESIVWTAGSGLLTTIGLTFSLYSLWHLRRSFAVFVQVREIVMSGPYAHVRHPMYLGYLFFLAGMVLAGMNVAWALLAIIQVGIMVYRAQLEESLLARTDERYQRYMEQTGFLFPRSESPQLTPDGSEIQNEQAA